jgi:hypothetical protein
LVRALLRATLPCSTGDESASVHAALAAESEHDALVREHAAKIARAALAMSVGRALSQQAAISATGLAAALEVSGASQLVALECTVDIVAHAEAIGGDEHAIALIRIALDDSAHDAAWWREELEAARVALAMRLGNGADVRGAVWLVSAEQSTVRWLDVTELERARAQLAETAERFTSARESGAWPGRPRTWCEQFRCGYVDHCHH